MAQQKTVVLGMSGGVDSSVAALLLQNQGYRVIGVFLKLYSKTKNPMTGECSYLDDLKMARKVALLLGIELHVLDYEQEYHKKILKPMFDEYRRGMTPNPDILCNKLMKFPLLMQAARTFKADFIATGHYTRVRREGKKCLLLMGKDRTKDQSYFLAELSEKDLTHLLFPIGDLTKQEVRAIAHREGFPNWNKHGTVGICFVGKQNMQDFLKQKIKEKKGKVVSPQGDLMGTHAGAAYYTIGQKAGEHAGIVIVKTRGTERKRWYVASKDVRKNEIMVAPEDHACLKTDTIALRTLHMLHSRGNILRNVRVRIRHLGKLYPGALIRKGKRYIFMCATKCELPAAGQIAVFYKGQQVVGSGEITAFSSIK